MRNDWHFFIAAHNGLPNAITPKQRPKNTTSDFYPTIISKPHVESTDMYHLGGNASLGGLLGYLPVAALTMSFNLSDVPIERVEGGRQRQGGRDRGIDLRCFPRNPLFPPSIFISNSISPHTTSFRLLSSLGASFLLKSTVIFNLASTAANTVSKETKSRRVRGDSVSKFRRH